MDLIVLLGVFALGLVWTSLLNGFAHRLLKERSVFDYKARCGSCDADLSWYDLLPLISHFIFGGKCRLCTSPLSLLYPLLELFGALVFTALWYIRVIDYGYLPYPRFLLDLLFVSALFLALRTDLEEMVILRVSSLYLIPVWLACAAGNFLEIDLLTSFFGALMGYFLPWLAGYLYRLARGIDGMGQGDFELLGMIGAFWGPTRMLDVLVVSCVVAVIFGVIFALSVRGTRNIRIPFAPFLVLGALIKIFS